MQENPKSNERKVTKDSFYEVPGVVRAESKEETGATPEGQTGERETGESIGSPEIKEPKGTEFKPPGESETGYTKESWTKPEKGIEEKGVSEDFSSQETNVPLESEFKAPGEPETGYTKESWTKPEKGMEEKEASEETTAETGAGAEEKTGEKTREEKRTIYTAKRRLTKSKKDRMLFGVCGGLGEYFDIDPTFIRLAFAILALQGIGIVIYIILAIIMPSDKSVEMVPGKEQ